MILCLNNYLPFFSNSSITTQNSITHYHMNILFTLLTKYIIRKKKCISVNERVDEDDKLPTTNPQRY